MDNFTLGTFKMEEHGSEKRDYFLFPPGEYRGRVIECYHDKFDTNGWVKVTWVIVDGKCQGKEFEKFLQLNHNPSRDNSEARLKYDRDMLANIFRASGFDKGISDWTDLVGTHAILGLETNTWEGKDRSQLGYINKDELTGSKKSGVASNPAPAAAEAETKEEDFDDDLPF